MSKYRHQVNLLVLCFFFIFWFSFLLQSHMFMHATVFNGIVQPSPRLPPLLRPSRAAQLLLRLVLSLVDPVACPWLRRGEGCFLTLVSHVHAYNSIQRHCSTLPPSSSSPPTVPRRPTAPPPCPLSRQSRRRLAVARRVSVRRRSSPFERADPPLPSLCARSPPSRDRCSSDRHDTHTYLLSYSFVYLFVYYFIYILQIYTIKMLINSSWHSSFVL